jgi:hypothetical protein
MGPVFLAAALLVHADVGFPVDEQVLIRESVRLLAAQTDGVVNVEVVFDFDFSPSTLIRLAGAPSLLRLDALDPKIGLADGQFKMPVLGWTTAAYGRVFLVPSRLITDEIYEHVVMHEILHLLGVLHVEGDRWAILCPYASATRTLTFADREAVRVLFPQLSP